MLDGQEFLLTGKVALTLDQHLTSRTTFVNSLVSWIETTKPNNQILNMSTMNKNSLWTNSNRSRYFLIPNNQNLTPGNFTIQTLTGISKQVDVTALTPLEITAVQAQPYIQAEIDRALKQTKEAFGPFNEFAAAAQGESATDPQSFQLPKNPFAALFDISQEELDENPDAVKESWQNLVQGFQDVVLGATSDDPSHLETAKTQMQRLQQHLQNQGINVNDSIQDLPNKLREKYHSPDSEPNLKASAEKLQEATQNVGQAFNDLLQTLKDGADKVRQAMEEDETNQPKQSGSETSESAEKN